MESVLWSVYAPSILFKLIIKSTFVKMYFHIFIISKCYPCPHFMCLANNI